MLPRLEPGDEWFVYWGSALKEYEEECVSIVKRKTEVRDALQLELDDQTVMDALPAAVREMVLFVQTWPVRQIIM